MRFNISLRQVVSRLLKNNAPSQLKWHPPCQCYYRQRLAQVFAAKLCCSTWSMQIMIWLKHIMVLLALTKARGMLNSFISTSHVRVYGIILHWMLMKSLLSQNYWDGETYITNNTAWYFRKQQPVTKIKNYAPMYATSSFCLFWVLIFRRPLWSCPRSEYLTPAVSLLDVDMCSIDQGNVAVSLMAYWFPFLWSLTQTFHNKHIRFPLSYSPNKGIAYCHSVHHPLYFINSLLNYFLSE